MVIITHSDDYWPTARSAHVILMSNTLHYITLLILCLNLHIDVSFPYIIRFILFHFFLAFFSVPSVCCILFIVLSLCMIFFSRSHCPHTIIYTLLHFLRS
jgi:hypothetical protein